MKPSTIIVSVNQKEVGSVEESDETLQECVEAKKVLLVDMSRKIYAVVLLK
jgi:hypothetical protein